ncbi:MAG: alkaline phosphatase [Bacteroidales bacterium]|nr:alkaline phosphatase [Bacteroidales bacterium]MBR5056644.1 alkaline phosphatase [Bacteroidales bacterium]
MKRFIKIFVFVVALSACTLSYGAKRAKYVFLFIGDGMGFSHVSLTEAYLAQQRGVIGNDPLAFTQFPVLGMATTFSESNPITDSSAAGTALSTGTKTKNGMLGMDADSLPLKSISYKIHEAGLKVGIMSTVQINHATPAAFYGHNVSRKNYYAIAQELPKTGFEFFGGGFLHPNGKEKDLRSIYEQVVDGGYAVARGLDEFASLKRDRIVLTAKRNPDEVLPYALGRKSDDLTLAQMLEAALQVLDNRKGFFIMAEGGKIDYAAHSNDAIGTITETIDMDEAVKVALEFYKKHPKETLIIVTADHETGGVSLGAKKGYLYDLNVFNDITESATTTDVEKYMSDKVVLKEQSEKARVGWTTTSHTGGAVPVWAIGAGSEAFAGRMDNTDIPKRICKAMKVQF